MKAILLLCGAALLSLAYGKPQYPQQSLPDTQTRDALDEFSQWSQRQANRTADAIQQMATDLSNLGQGAVQTVEGTTEDHEHVTRPPSFWERLSSGISDTYEKAKEKTQELAGRVRESVG